MKSPQPKQTCHDWMLTLNPTVELDTDLYNLPRNPYLDYDNEALVWWRECTRQDL